MTDWNPDQEFIDFIAESMRRDPLWKNDRLGVGSRVYTLEEVIKLMRSGSEDFAKKLYETMYGMPENQRKFGEWKARREKWLGRPVSNEEVLKSLGHPSGWGVNQRFVELRNRLIGGKLAQIKVNGIESYLKYLRNSLQDPPGCDTGLVSKEENEKIKVTETEAIKAEIRKFEELLEKAKKEKDQTIQLP